MVKINITYEDKDQDKPIYKSIQLMSRWYKNVKIKKEYKDKKGHHVVSIEAE